MKKSIAFLVAVLFIALSAFPVPVFAQDNAFDRMGDWMATVGKKEPEMTMILTQRRAARATERAEKTMKEQSKKLEKGMKDMFGK